MVQSDSLNSASQELCARESKLTLLRGEVHRLEQRKALLEQQLYHPSKNPESPEERRKSLDLRYREREGATVDRIICVFGQYCCP